MINNIAVYGMGKLGRPLAEYMDKQGFDIIGVDLDMKKFGNMKIGYTTNGQMATEMTDASIIFVGTPNAPDGAFNLRFIKEVAEEIGEGLKEKNKYHLIVLRSTVLPGATREISGLIEKISGKKCGKDFGMVHSPEFLALGQVTHDIAYPQFVLIGEQDKKAGNEYEKICKKMIKNNAPIIRTSLENAELAKLFINNYITMKINFANFMGQIADRTPGTNISELCKIVGMDNRIGNKYLNAGLSYGGTCFPRDNEAFIAYLNKIKIDATLPELLEVMNEKHVEYIVDKIGSTYNKHVAFLGIAFKPGTDVDVESATVKIANKIREQEPETKLSYHDFILTPRLTPEECIENADIIVIAHPDKRYKKLNFKGKKVIDPWSILE